MICVRHSFPLWRISCTVLALIYGRKEVADDRSVFKKVFAETPVLILISALIMECFFTHLRLFRFVKVQFLFGRNLKKVN